MLRRLLCLLLPHRPDNRRVKKVTDGSYYGYCRNCGTRIQRLRRGKWKKAWRWPETPAA